jgi:DNA invertase Pin-like site-specific DNA recombinase
MARIGYARVSTEDQELTVQQNCLAAAGCVIIRTETASGGTLSGRTELATIMEFIHAGDELVVVKLDRLGRSTRDVLNLVHHLSEKDAALTVLEPSFSTRDAAGPILVTVLGMVAEMERKFIRERQRAGIDAAKAKGVYRGRKPLVPVEKVRALHAAGQRPTSIARALGISRMSVHRALKAAA